MPKEMRRGRPPKTLGEPKRAQFNTRLRPSLKQALDAAAQANGRSLSEEIEFRLEQSFSEEARARDLRETLALALGADVAGLTLAIGLVTRDVVKWPALGPKLSLFSNAFVFDQMVAGISTVIDILRPAGDAAAPPGGDDVPSGAEEAVEQWHTLGRDVGGQICWEIADYPERLGPWGSSIQEWLGPDAIERIRVKVAAFYGAR